MPLRISPSHPFQAILKPSKEMHSGFDMLSRGLTMFHHTESLNLTSEVAVMIWLESMEPTLLLCTKYKEERWPRASQQFGMYHGFLSTGGIPLIHLLLPPHHSGKWLQATMLIGYERGVRPCLVIKGWSEDVAGWLLTTPWCRRFRWRH